MLPYYFVVILFRVFCLMDLVVFFCNLIYLIGRFCGISHLSRSSTSSIVLGRGIPLVSGSNSIKPPPINVMTPEWHNREGKNHWQQKYIDRFTTMQATLWLRDRSFVLSGSNREGILKIPPEFLQESHQISAVFPPYYLYTSPRRRTYQRWWEASPARCQSVYTTGTVTRCFRYHKKSSKKTLQSSCMQKYSNWSGYWDLVVVKQQNSKLDLLLLPDICWVELNVNKYHQL